MRQYSLPFKYEEETKTSGLSGLAGLSLYLELLYSLNIHQAMRKELDSGVHENAIWKPSDVVLALILLNLAGEEHVDDLRLFEADSGFCSVCFVPSSLATSKRGYEFRYVATREALKEQGVLPGLPEKECPFPVAQMNGRRYKIHTLVTNRNTSAEKLIPWYNKRCGHSEEAHAVLKSDLAGGILPCNNFHANAIWWWVAVISHNIHSIFKLLCCDESWHRSRMKRIRFCVITIAGRVIERGRQLYIRLTEGHPATNCFSQSGKRSLVCDHARRNKRAFGDSAGEVRPKNEIPLSGGRRNANNLILEPPGDGQTPN